MAWRPSEWVLEGELDNTQLGWTIGWVRIQGRDEPLKLKLAGNCHADLAGWKFRIVRIDPIPDWAEAIHLDGIATDQTGTIGDVTADQMIKHFECSPTEFIERCYGNDRPQTTWRKCLYLEWFSHRNGRVVIQSTRLAVERLGERVFELTEVQYAEQAKQNSEEMNYFMFQIGDALTDIAPEDDEREPPTC